MISNTDMLYTDMLYTDKLQKCRY